MMSSSLNKDYMDIDEFLSSKDLCDGFSFPEGDFNDDDFSSIADPDEGTDNLSAILEDQLNEYTANEIEFEEFRPPSPLNTGSEGKSRSISPDSSSSTRKSQGEQGKCTGENVKTRGKSSRGGGKKIDKETENSRTSNARTSTWQLSKSSDKKCLATSVEIEGVSYTYNLLPTSKGRKQRKQSVPGDLKDGKYWDRRLKNNMAAKRSRDLRRRKEMTVAFKAAALEAENDSLKSEVIKLKEQVEILSKRLEEYSKQSSSYFEISDQVRAMMSRFKTDPENDDREP